jgi:hypothetical protein
MQIYKKYENLAAQDEVKRQKMLQDRASKGFVKAQGINAFLSQDLVCKLGYYYKDCTLLAINLCIDDIFSINHVEEKQFALTLRGFFLSFTQMEP